jgi:hypothetical protein
LDLAEIVDREERLAAGEANILQSFPIVLLSARTAFEMS